MNLSAGLGLTSFDGSRLLEWPPLYPALLGAIHSVTGLSAFAAAHLVQAASFLGLAACLSLLFLKIFPDNFALALAGNILAEIGAVVISGFDLVGSDYLHLFLAMLTLLLTGYYVQSRSPRVFVALAVTGMLAMLDRYIGIAAIAVSVCTVAALAGSLQQRIARSAALALSALPTGIWLVITSAQLNERAPVAFAENFRWFSQSMLEWFLPAARIEEHLTFYITMLWTIILGMLLLVYWRRHSIPAFARPVLLYGAFYMLALFGSASIAYYNRLAGRFLLPVYVPFITLLLVSGHSLLEAAKGASLAWRRTAIAGTAGVLTALTVMLLSVSVPVIRESHAGIGTGENSYNTAEWRGNAAVQYWLAHPPPGEYMVLSNYSDLVAFLSQRACLPSPRQKSGPYATDAYPVAGYTSELFSAGEDVYLIWIEPNVHDYFYTPDDLRPIAKLKVMFTGSDGSVYRLRPRTGT